METRAALIARAIAQSPGWEVSLAVKDYGQPKHLKADGVTLIRHAPLAKKITDNVVPRFRKYGWRPVIHLDRRDLHFAWQLPVYLLMQLLPRAWIHRFWRSLEPDVVCCFGNNPTSAEAIAECQRHGLPTVLFIASDDDLSSDYHPDAIGMNDYGTPKRLAWYAVAMADHVLVQTARQRDLLEENFGRSAEIIHNPIDIPPDARNLWTPRNERRYVLWIGRSDGFNKRPALLVELARSNPEVSFLMVVNKSDAEILQQLQENAPDNVRIIERVPHEEIPRLFSQARLFVNTSRYEGFPNTFLQAAVHGVPVLSLSVDPEEILSGEGCGLCANGDIAQLERMLKELWEDSDLAEAYATRFFELASTRHALAKQATRIETYLSNVIDQTPRNPLPLFQQPFANFPVKR